MLDREFKITKAEEGAAFAVHVVANSPKNEVVGKHGDALKVGLITPSTRGIANETLLRFLAEKLAIDQANLEIAAGRDSTEKMIIVVGITPGEVESRLLG